MDDLNAYKVDPRHVAVSDICKSIRADRVAVDLSLIHIFMISIAPLSEMSNLPSVCAMEIMKLFFTPNEQLQDKKIRCV